MENETKYIITKTENSKTENYLGHKKGRHSWGLGQPEVFNCDELQDAEGVLLGQAATMFGESATLKIVTLSGKTITTRQGEATDDLIASNN